MKSQNVGSLVVSFSHSDASTKSSMPYHFILVREKEPQKAVHSFKGELKDSAIKYHRVEQLAPGNYLLLGIVIPDRKPGNNRIHQLMIYPGIETTYDVNYSRTWELHFN